MKTPEDQARETAEHDPGSRLLEMALTDGDFEKGEANGARDALRLIDALVGVIDRLSPPFT